MPVDTVHPEYQRWAQHWRKMRDVVLGQEAMERATVGATLPGLVGGTSTLGRDYYLPRLGGQDEQQYRAYVRRALFYGATARTIDALVGAIFRRDPVLTMSEDMEQQMEDVDLGGTPLATFAKVAVAEVLTTGRYGVLVDMPPLGSPDARPYWTGFMAEDICSWMSARIDGSMQLVRVVLRESSWVQKGDEFGFEQVSHYRVLDLDESGTYRVRIFTQAEQGKDWLAVEELYPTRKGERLTAIPFYFMAPLSVGASPERPPLLDLADVNLAHYRKSADYAHGLHFTALPTPWLADREIPKGATFKIGSEQAWTLSEVGSCGMLEFSGAGMGAIKEAMLDDEARMAHLGAELLAPEKRAVEAADALRIRGIAKAASLASVASTASWALSRAAMTHAWWIGESDEAVENTGITLNSEFMESRMDPAELTAWVGARQAGEVTRRTFVERLAKHEALGDRTVEDELVELEAENDSRAERDALKAEAERFKQVSGVMMDQMSVKDGEDDGEAA